jgi:multiple sugar transport system ATP-binding protein
MALIEMENISKKFGTITAVDHLNLSIEAGEFLTLLGPSGCGKTTVLRMIAGLEIPDEGTIRIHGVTVFSSREGIYVMPGKRGIGLVFQSYALWPHMTVFDNVAFGLQVQGSGRKDLEGQVGEALAYMQLQGMEKRYPQQLSGGQQQRVALARMLVTRPSVFLMDEPLSNLDAKLRMEMRTEIKRLHWESKATTIYVTHDQNEALTMSTKIAVMNHGVLPTINLIQGKILRRNGAVFFQNDTLQFAVPLRTDWVGKKVIAAIRPEDIRIFSQEERESMAGEVYSLLPAGAELIIQAKKGNLIFNVRKMGEASWEMGEMIYLQLPVESIIFYDGESGALIYPPEEE